MHLYNGLMLLDQLFTRQQVSEMTGVPDDVLAYWIKSGLLVPTEGGRGRGSHRRFDCWQINLAAILGHLRRFGSNITSLKAVADLFQRAIAIDAEYRLKEPTNYSVCAKTIENLSQFRAGRILTLKRYPKEKGFDAEEFVPTSEEEVISHGFDHLWDLEDDINVLHDIARKLPISDVKALRIADPFTYELRTGAGTDNLAFLMARDEDENLQFNFSSSGLNFDTFVNRDFWDRLESGVIVSFTAINNRLWKDDLVVLHARHNAMLSERTKQFQNERLAELDEHDPAEARRLRRVWGLES